MHPPSQPPPPYAVGHQYTRPDIYEILGLGDGQRGGDWNNGYHRHGTDWYIFAGIQTTARTGHDYGNRWEGGQLYWRGETASRLRHPSIQSMVDGSLRVLVFTRDNAREPFTFQGVARANRTEDTVPVTVWWEFPGRAVEPPTVAIDPRTGEAAGFGDTEENREVELAAVAFVTHHYLGAGWFVLSREAEKIGFDLECTRGAEVRHVEVKGVRGSEPSFLLTEGERARAASDPTWRLAVVTEALTQAPTLLEATGTEFLAGWQLDAVTWRARRRGG